MMTTSLGIFDETEVEGIIAITELSQDEITPISFTLNDGTVDPDDCLFISI
jgi:hypothetical protein